MILTLEELRAHVETELEDDDLQLLVDAAEQAIVKALRQFGVAYDEGLVETHDGGQSYIFLRWPATSIESITETDGGTDTVLEADDYRIRGDGVSVLRLASGTNPRTWWGAPVRVEYSAAHADAELGRVQIALVKLDLNHNPGVASESIGSWSEQATSNSAFNYQLERESILASLNIATAPGFA